MSGHESEQNGILAGDSLASMAIEAIYIYPIKSLRGTAVTSTNITSTGPPLDRRFFLLRDHGPSAAPRYTALQVSSNPALVLFTTTLLDAEGTPTTDATTAVTLRVRHTPPPSAARKPSERMFPLRPDVATAPRLPVTMHQSGAVARAMPPALSSWFADILGLPVVLAYHAEGSAGRRVLGNVAPGAAARNAAARKRKRAPLDDSGWTGSWLGGVLARAAGLRGPDGLDVAGEDEALNDGGHRISYADCAPLLVVSAASAAEVSRRVDALNAADENLDDAAARRPRTVMDVTKFRPNIVVRGAPDAWAEDFWAVLAITPSSSSSISTNGNASTKDTDPEIELDLTTNCVRCPSLNVDYATGAASGRMLQTLQRDRRVDTTNKYNPVFGRYAFLRGARAARVRVGDGVRVGAWNAARCDLKWPGIGGTARDDWYPV